jgi:endonuclease/exonuclease/phosphatase family metal-dependent hydrolase
VALPIARRGLYDPSMTLAGSTKPVPARRPFALYAAALAVFAAAGFAMTQGLRGEPATAWMGMFAPGDFVAPGALRTFLAELRAAIPPWLAALEILEQRHTGALEATTVWLYRFFLVGGYLAAMALTWPSVARLLAAFALSLLFLWATVLLHPRAPGTADAAFPFLLVAYFGLLRLGASATRAPWAAAALAAGGLALALAALTRPYLILFVPPLAAGAWFALRRPWRFAALLAPVAVVAGGWHGYQAAIHGQIPWGNHWGFDLARAWPMVPQPELIPESAAVPAAPGRRQNLNTPEHAENNRRIVRAVLDHARAHPADSALHALGRIAVFVGADHQLAEHAPDDRYLPVYAFLVKYFDLAAMAGVAAMLVAFLLAPGRIGALAGDVGNQILALAALSIAVVAVTATGDEARLQLSVLPLLACVPLPHLPGRARKPDFVRDQRRRRRALAIGLAATAVVVAAVEVLAWGSRRTPARAAGGGPVAPAAVLAPLAEAPAGEVRLRVAQFTIRGGAWRDGAAEARANGACLKAIDVAGLNEVRGPGPFGHGESQAAILAREAGLTALFAPTERRWWREHFGNALLSAAPILRWERASLPRQAGRSHRGLLAADIDLGGRTVRVLVTQTDPQDRQVQIAAVAAVFDKAPSPALLLADFGAPEAATDQALQRLIGNPAYVVVAEPALPPAAPGQGGYIVAKGFRRLAASVCKGSAAAPPRLGVELVVEP